jgi:hypothetical protein
MQEGSHVSHFLLEEFARIISFADILQTSRDVCSLLARFSQVQESPSHHKEPTIVEKISRIHR